MELARIKLEKKIRYLEKDRFIFVKFGSKIKFKSKDNNNTYFDTIVPFFCLAWLFHQEHSIHMLILVVAIFLSQNGAIYHTMK